MKIARVRDTALALTAVAVLAACATAPAQNALLDEARAGYERAVNNAYAARGGTVELQSARTALQRAQAALEAGDDTVVVEHYAYLAKRRIETALEAGKVVAGEEAVAAAALERQRIMMEVRTREAEEMQKRALASAADADAARKRAMEQQEQAATARKQAEEQLARAQAATAAARAADEQAKRLAAQLEEMKAKKTERGMVLTLGDVLFDTGRSDLKPGALRTLEQLTAFLTENPERSAIIEGHTDSVGAEAFNQRLSEQRAQAVQNALIERGIAPARLSAVGFGPSKPVVGNDTAAGRQQNRRVEIVLPDVK
ncbi:MAG: OmpA family protein [Betaproteobacteria bacterium]|nr:OmpA family protein [Betaproteobacteria bacterium]MDH5212027.1 OmpA family protein [Betaproteobacteria bacterium]